MFTNSQQNRLRFDATPKKQLADTLSTFSQTEVTVQPSAKKSSTVMSSIFAKEIRAIPSTSKQIHLDMAASSTWLTSWNNDTYPTYVPKKKTDGRQSSVEGVEGQQPQQQQHPQEESWDKETDVQQTSTAEMINNVVIFLFYSKRMYRKQKKNFLFVVFKGIKRRK
jgi:hypothetical protein